MPEPGESASLYTGQRWSEEADPEEMSFLVEAQRCASAE